MSNCSTEEVTKTVLGIQVSYFPYEILKQLSIKAKFLYQRRQYKGQDNFERKVWIAIVIAVYANAETPILPAQAEGILSQFLSGHCASVQLLIAAGLIAYNTNESDSSG